MELLPDWILYEMLMEINMGKEEQLTINQVNDIQSFQ